jgi:predicted nucleotidyltransferase
MRELERSLEAERAARRTAVVELEERLQEAKQARSAAAFASTTEAALQVSAPPFSLKLYVFGGASVALEPFTPLSLHSLPRSPLLLLLDHSLFTLFHTALSCSSSTTLSHPLDTTSNDARCDFGLLAVSAFSIQLPCQPSSRHLSLVTCADRCMDHLLSGLESLSLQVRVQRLEAELATATAAATAAEAAATLALQQAASSEGMAEKTVAELRRSLAGAQKEVEAAKTAASLAAMVGEARQEAVWSLTKQVNELQQQLKYTVDVEEVEALEAQLAAANVKLSTAVSREEVEEIDAALAAVAEEAINGADARVRAAEAEVAAAESRIKAAEAAAATAKQEATLAAMVGETRQEAVWSLTKQVNELQQQLKYTVDVEEVEALEAELAQANARLSTSVSREEVEEIDAALAAVAEEAINDADARVRAAEVEVAAARREAKLAAMVGETRQEAVWSLTKQVGSHQPAPSGRFSVHLGGKGAKVLTRDNTESRVVSHNASHLSPHR